MARLGYNAIRKKEMRREKRHQTIAGIFGWMKKKAFSCLCDCSRCDLARLEFHSKTESGRIAHVENG